MSAQTIGRNLITFSLCLLLVVLPFEDDTTSLWIALKILVLAGGVTLVVAGEWRRRPRLPWTRHPFVAATWHFAALSAIIFAVAWLAQQIGEAGENQLAYVAEHFGKEFAPILFFGLIVWNGRRHLNPEAPPCSRLLKIIDALIWIWLIFALLSAAASINPEISFRHLRKETGPYLIVYMIALEAASRETDFRRMVRTIAITGVIIAFASCVFWYFYGSIIGDSIHYEAAKWMRDRDLIYHNWPFDPSYPWRAMWPTEHPNRMGSLCIILSFSLLMGATMVKKRELQVLWAVLSLVPAYTIFLSQTRGAMLAWGGGILALYFLTLFIVAKRIRWYWTLGFLMLPLLLGGAGWSALPQNTRDHMKQMLMPKFYQEEFGTFYMRQFAWRAAVQLSLKNPWLGIGHGWENFENIYMSYQENRQDGEWENKSHAHANLLEVLVENGYPAAAVWVAFNFLLLLALLMALLKTRGDPRYQLILAMLLALNLAIIAFGVTNFSLRIRVGMLIWIVTAWSLARARIALAQTNLGKSESVD